MLENHLKKAGIGLALLSALMPDCGFVATQRNYFRYTPMEKPALIEIKGYTPKKVEFYFDHPKQADINNNGRVEPKELKAYVDTLFKSIRDAYSR